ncbi:hypothetical protein [Intestinimonas butyriciproducens]|jgi:hypothetical protein|uniref:hypothetical protein n=1 Tax=Intestinimonas butyriciproducens TaxID=1297617 RepID=UPI0018A11B19|nr:hypothetical protein [Intestinimonas butyriciproducens]
MTVTSIKDAWNEAQRIFPTDYAEDKQRSKRAGYPIYHSTADGVNAWISDLGNRLEVNLPDGKSVNIWIEAPVEKPEEAAPVLSEERKEVARRLQRITFYYTEEYVEDLAKKEKEDAAIKELEANPSGEIRCMVLTAEHNAKVMMDCIKDLIRAVNILRDKNEEVDEWMLAGITAMLDKVAQLKVLPYDLPASVCGLLGAQYR